MRQTIFALAALAVLVACRGRDADFEAGGEADTATFRVPDVDIDLVPDTLGIPTVGTKQDTLIYKRPAITGTTDVEIKRPTVDVKKRP